MALNKDIKTSIIANYKTHETDTGSAEVQVALLTQRLNDLNGHLKSHGKDHHSRRGLLKMVSRRRKLLDHLKKEDATRYQNIITRLWIRR